MDSAVTECASQSVGPVNQLFGLLIKTILAAQCSITPPNLWPEDYGEKFIENSMLLFSFTISICYGQSIFEIQLKIQMIFF